MKPWEHQLCWAGGAGAALRVEGTGTFCTPGLQGKGLGGWSGAFDTVGEIKVIFRVRWTVGLREMHTSIEVPPYSDVSGLVSR